MFKSWLFFTLCAGTLFADDLIPGQAPRGARGQGSRTESSSKSWQLSASCPGTGCPYDFITGQAARAVIGQDTFTENVPGTSGQVNGTQIDGIANNLSGKKFGGVGGLALAGNTLFATDSNRIGLFPNNNRVLVYRNIDQQIVAADASITVYLRRCPVCGGEANVVMGQSAFDGSDFSTTQSGMRLPTGVASDGIHVAVADTLNNRVLLWNSVPTVNGSDADVVLGQTGFTTNRPGIGNTALRGPQGVWIQDGRLFVADTGNNRVLIWNTLPTQNGQAASVVLGQPDFDTAPPANLIDLTLPGSATTMLNPVGVSSDGVRLIVSDLGYNRILIFKSIPTQNQTAADIVLGQIDFTKTFSNQTQDLCESTGTDTDGNPTYPSRCAATMNFPRSAISDGTRLFVADTGNDRVLIFNQIASLVNGARADVILGQRDEFATIVTSLDIQNTSASYVTPTPTSLAWDGKNLYVADPTDYRILIFSPGNQSVGIDDVVNSASRAIFANGTVLIAGSIQADDSVTVTIAGTEYKYTVLAEDSTETVAIGLKDLINGANDGAGDPNVLAYTEPGRATIGLTARSLGVAGQGITLTTAVSTSALIAATVSTAVLSGIGDATLMAPGSLITIKAAPGATLADTTVKAPDNADVLPWDLGGVEVYVDGYRAPLFMVSPTEISSQIPYEMSGATSVNLFVRFAHEDGTVTVTNAIGLQLRGGAPGIFGCDPAGLPACNPGGSELRVLSAVHASDYATGTISVDGTAQENDTGTITIGDVPIVITTTKDDTLATIRDRFIEAINADPQMPVTAIAANQFTRIRLRAKVPGPEGNGTPLFTQVTSTNTTGVALSLTATNSAMCCASVAGRLITPENPAIPGETIIFYAAGLGLVDPLEEELGQVTGTKFVGSGANTPKVSVSALIGPGTGNVLSAGAKPGTIGLYEILVELSGSLLENPFTKINISQQSLTSNTLTFPVGPPPQQ